MGPRAAHTLRGTSRERQGLKVDAENLGPNPTVAFGVAQTPVEQQYLVALQQADEGVIIADVQEQEVEVPQTLGERQYGQQVSQEDGDVTGEGGVRKSRAGRRAAKKVKQGTMADGAETAA